MKLSAREAAAWFARPNPKHCALLIHGPDSMRVALRRQQVIAVLAGDEAEEEMRLERLHAGELRKDAARLTDALKAQGFFAGPRVVFVEEAGDALTKTVKAALEDWREGDATLVVTAGALAARSSLRKLFEGHARAASAAVYPDPPGRGEVEATLRKAGLERVSEQAMGDLLALARALDPGDFAQTVEKLSLYMLGTEAPVAPEDVAACAPLTTEAALDDALYAIAEGRAGEVGRIMQRLEGQGMNPTTVCIGATRHFRSLHLAASHDKGPEAGLSAARPPVFGPRRDRMLRQARALGVRRLETVLSILTDTDLALRSSRPAPRQALLERAFIRIAMLAARG